MNWLNTPLLFKTILDLGVLFVTVLLMITVGLELEGRHFREVGQRKWTVGLLLGGQVVLLPLLGIAVAQALDLPRHLSAGILLVAACPVGDIANFYTLIARGNAALSLVLNTLSCLFCAATMSVVFAAYDRLFPQHFVLTVPTTQLVVRLVLMLLIPAIAGMAVRRFRPDFAIKCARTLRNLSFAGVGFLLMFVLVSRREQMIADWQPAVVAANSFIISALVVGLVFARMLRLGASDSFTTGVLFAVRNVGLATAIAITLLGHLEYAVFAAVYFATEVPLLFGAVALYRRWWAHASDPAKAPAAPELYP
jgi:bile acid:Na+ symporter, BASS family